MIAELSFLITICARERGLVPKRAFRFKQNQTVNEELLLELADRHGVNGLLYKGLSSSHPNLLTENGMDTLRKRLLFHKVRVQRLLAEWPGIIETAERSDIPVLTIKGPALALQLYGSPHSREYCDLDLFIPTKGGDLHLLIADFDKTGYHIAAGNHSSTPSQHRFALQKTNHLVVANEKKKVGVEIHSNLFGLIQKMYTVPAQELFKRSGNVEWNGKKFLSLGKEDNTVFIFTHSIKHAWSCLKWVLDGALLFHSYSEKERKSLLRMVKELGLERVFASSIRFIRTIIELPLSDSIKSMLEKRDGTVNRIVSYLSRSFQGKIAYPSQKKRDKVNRLLFQLKLKKSIPYKLSVLKEKIIPGEKEFELIALPNSFSFLYWIIRPVRLLLLGWRRP